MPWAEREYKGENANQNSYPSSLIPLPLLSQCPSYRPSPHTLCLLLPLHTHPIMPSAAATLLPTSNEKSMATSHTDRCALNRTDQIHSVECQQTRRHPRRTIPFILAAAALSSLALFLVAASTGRGCLFNSPAPSVASLVVQGQDTLGEWIMKERKVAHWAILDNMSVPSLSRSLIC